MQEEWKTIGFAPQKMNTKIFERFRTACDSFFTHKAEFFKSMKDNLSINLEKKIEKGILKFVNDVTQRLNGSTVRANQNEIFIK